MFEFEAIRREQAKMQADLDGIKKNLRALRDAANRIRALEKEVANLLEVREKIRTT